MFEKNLNELIKGIRAHKGSEAKYIDSAIGECRKEIKSRDLEIKAQAILKLTYLQIYGYELSWASFQVIEVMSSSIFKEKTIGYLAAALSFKPDTDVLMLTTNLIKKDLASAKPTEVSIALDGLSHIATPGLAMDLFSDLLPMLNHSKPYVRKKAVLVMYKIFLQYPDALRVAFPRLREKLDDEDISVVSATVNVICELARKNPKNYLPLAPQLFNLLKTSNNNWMVIKIIKLFTSLIPLEPRLVRKLAPPLAEIISSTSAMSLLYEAIQAVIIGQMLTNSPQADNLANICVKKLCAFLEDNDQNLKYVGLLALAKVTSTHADLVYDHHDLILSCIDDADISIRLRALDLIVEIIFRETLADVVKQLMLQLLEPAPDSTGPILPDYYRVELVRRVLAMARKNNYANIGNNFEWYIAVLVDLARIAKVDVGTELGEEIWNVTARVKSVRAFSVRILSDLLRTFQFTSGDRMEGQAMVVGAAAWIIGEYCSLLEHPKTALEALLTPYIAKLPTQVQSIHLQAIPKVFSAWATEVMTTWSQDRKLEVEFMIEQILRWIDQFQYSTDLEVQERAVAFYQIFLHIQMEIHKSPIPEPRQYHDEATESWDSSRPHANFQSLSDLASLFSGTELNPVGPKAQRKVPIPEGLNLDNSLSSEQQFISWPDANLEEEDTKVQIKHEPVAPEHNRQEYLDRVRDDPFYILSHYRQPISRSETPSGEEDIDSIPIVQFDGGTNLLTPIATKVRKKKKRPREIILDEPQVDIAADEMPENVLLSDNEANGQTEQRKGGTNILSSKQVRGLEDIDFEEEERLEREAIEAEQEARKTRMKQVPVEAPQTEEEILIVERAKKKKMKKKKKEDGTTEAAKKTKKKKANVTEM